MAAVAVVLFLAGAILVLGGILHANPPPPDAQYVGSKKCKLCHIKGGIYKRWEKMRHATNFATLKPEHYTMKDELTGRMCLDCHTTGYGEPSGFVSVEKTPHLTSVGCESCHGPGSLHVAWNKKTENRNKVKARDPAALKELAKTIDRDPGSRCIRCHNPHNSYEKYGTGK
jgi:hypothetical protein